MAFVAVAIVAGVIWYGHGEGWFSKSDAQAAIDAKKKADETAQAAVIAAAKANNAAIIAFPTAGI